MKLKRGISYHLDHNVCRQLASSGISRVLAGISGGADSTALLLSLKASGTEVYAVHCNFHLRGEESMRDQLWVEELCRRVDVPLAIVDFDVEEYMREHPVSVEMACRDMRYLEFHKLADSMGAQRIAVAHNADDNMETLLLNLFRGSGVKGLKGMIADNGRIIRPLLGITRKEIERYLEEKGEEYVVDSTNLKSDIKRNFLRNDVIPMLESRWPGVRKAIRKTIENLQTEDRVLTRIEDTYLPEGDFLSLQDVASAPDEFWVIYKFAAAHGATRDVAKEIFDVYKKRAGSQTIVGKRWKSGRGTLKFTMKGLKFEE